MSIGREYYDEEGNNQQILEKLDANLPALKEDYEKVRDGWLTVASDETISTPMRHCLKRFPRTSSATWILGKYGGAMGSGSELSRENAL